jgi:SAM-dependent methyltransferase
VARTSDLPSPWKDQYEQSELLEVDCPLCGARRHRDIAVEFGIAVARCGECALVYTRTPRPEPQEHYSVSRDEFLRKYERFFRGDAPHPRDRNYDDVLSALERVCAPGELLDVGSHCGFFLRRARARGWRVTGVEPSAASSALARERFDLDVKTGFLDDRFSDACYDAVTLVDVLEHVGRPRPLLREIARVLRPGGVVLAKVPNAAYLAAKYRLLRRVPGAVVDAFDAREHLVHYSHLTLERLLKEEGFTVSLSTVPSPIQTGGRLRCLFRSIGVLVAQRVPRGADLPFATDVVVIAHKSLAPSL